MSEFEFGYTWVLWQILMSFFVGKNLCIKVLLKNICNEAGSHLGNWHRESSRHTERGELLEGRGQVCGISQRNSPESGKMSSLVTSLAATKANSKAVGPGNILRKGRQPHHFLSWPSTCSADYTIGGQINALLLSGE